MMSDVQMEWPFDQAPDVAAVTTVWVLEKGLSILVVQHFDDDHSWAFLCGTTDDDKDGRIIGMGEALRMDMSFRSIADLRPGWIARRAIVGERWKRERFGEVS
jgi:hypothetical protein